MESSLTHDLIGDLGYLTLGSRLRRIGERLQATTQAYLARNGVEIQVAQLSVLYALGEQEPAAIGDLAQTLGLSQPGVTRMVERLEAGGWIETEKRDADRRQRFVRLTAKGEALVKQAHALHWPVIESSVAALADQLSGRLIDQLGGLEAAIIDGALDQEFDQRTREAGDGAA